MSENKDTYGFDKCLVCGKENALKNGRCVQCEREGKTSLNHILTRNPSPENIFGDIFGGNRK